MSDAHDAKELRLSVVARPLGTVVRMKPGRRQLARRPGRPLCGASYAIAKGGTGSILLVMVPD